MGAPYTCMWNEFTIREMNESLNWLKNNIDLIDKYKPNYISDEAALACELIKREIPKKDYWFKHMWYINLPDAKDGYSILNFDQGRFAMETYSRGIVVPGTK